MVATCRSSAQGVELPCGSQPGNGELCYAVVRGKDPVATGRLGDILAFAKEAPDSESIVQVAVGRIDGVILLPDVWYGVDLTKRMVN